MQELPHSQAMLMWPGNEAMQELPLSQAMLMWPGNEAMQELASFPGCIHVA